MSRSLGLLEITQWLHERYGAEGPWGQSHGIVWSRVGLSPTIRETPALEVIYDQVELGYSAADYLDINHSLFLALYLLVEEREEGVRGVEDELLELADDLVLDLLEVDRTLGSLVDLALPVGIDFSVIRRGTAFFRSATIALGTGNPPPQLYSR